MKRTGRHISRRTAAALTVLFAIVTAATLTGGAAALTNGYSSAPSIISDKADYSPGETVTLTGSNWGAGEVVHINVNDDDGQTWSRDVDVVASATGAIEDQFQLPAYFVANYRVTATGPVSGTATTTFTDGNVTLHLATSEGVSSMTVSWARFDGKDAPGGNNTNCSGAPSASGTLTISAGASANIPGFGGSKDSARLTSVTSATPGKAFDRWTSGTATVDSGTTIPGSPTPCIANGSAGTNGNINDGYAHFTTTNSAPVIASNNASVTVSEGATAANAGTWSDANSGDTVTLSASVGTVTKSGTNASGTWSWSYGTTDGPTQSQTVTITADDGQGGVTSTSFALGVSNVTPAVNAAANQNATEDASTSFNLGSFTDPGADSPWAVTVNWGDGSANTTFNQTATGSITAQSHTYANPGTFTVTVSVMDKDNATGSTSFTVVVAASNHAPTANAGGPYSGDEGSAIQLDGSGSSDPDAGDTLSYSWSVDAGAPCSFSSATAQKPTITCADNGSYTVLLTVTDNHGASSAASTAALNVENVAPSATFSNNGPVDETQSFQLSLSEATDPSSADTTAGFQYAFDCGDGSGYGAFDASNSRTCSTTDDGVRSVKGKVKDKDGGVSEYTGSVTVNNVAPSLSGQADQASDEGSSKSFDLGSFSDPGADSPWKVHVDWGDGSSSDPADKTVSGSLGNASHSYDDDGTYTVTVKVTDSDGASGEATFKATVANVAPTGTLGNDGPVDEASPTTVSFSAQHDPSTADTTAGFHYAYACDNGSLAGATYAGSGTAASKQCTYADDGTYTVRARIIDEDGGYNEYTTAVVVKNVPPTLTPPTDDTGDEGSSKSFGLGSFSDPGANDDTWKLHITWGDGSAATDLTYSSRGALGMAPHAYADNGTYTVTETITDKDGGSDTQTFKVVIKNVDPTVTAAADQSSDEGSAKSFDLGSFSDPGANDNPWKVHVDWGDGSSSDPADKAATGSLGNASHNYDDNGTYTVKVTVTDKDGGSGSASFKVAAANAKPTATLSNNGPVDEGSPVTASFSAQSDPSSADTAAGFHNAFDCSNGSLAGATYANSGTSASKQCTFADNGTYPVRARTIDKDDGYSEYTTSVTVNNVKPTVTAPADQSSDEGESKSFDLGSFSDPGPDSPWAVDVDWGDGSAHYTTSKSATGSLGSASHTYADNGVKTVTVKVTDKDGGSSSATFKVTVGNIAPTITSFSGINSFSGALVFAPTTFSGTFTDPGLVDNPWAAAWSWDGILDPAAAQTYGANGTSTHNFSQTHQFTSASCSHTATVKIADKDEGSDTETATVQVGTGAFLPPMTNQPVTNKLKNGQVLPVKVQLTDCSGAPLNGLSPAIRLIGGDQTTVADDGAVVITPTSVSSADTTGVMRSNGSDGSYIYNMSVSIPLNTDYTVVIYPYGTTPPNNTLTLRHVIQATK